MLSRNINKTTAIINKYIPQTNITEQHLQSLSLKQFSILSHEVLLNKVKDPLTWKRIELNFLERLTFTSDPHQIRSYSRVIYSIGKSKQEELSKTQTYETKFAVLLPYASHQSFTTIVTSLSRMGPLSHEFCHIVEVLYYKNYQQFNIREKVQINYVLCRNGHKVDKKLIDQLDKMNLKEIITLLRCYVNCSQLDREVLEKGEKAILPRKRQMNTMDLSHLCQVYFDGAIREIYPLSSPMELLFEDSYKSLRQNINEVAFQKIWKLLPQVVNKGYLRIGFVEEVLKTLKILRKKKLFSERVWLQLNQNFRKFDNTEIKKKLKTIT